MVEMNCIASSEYNDGHEETDEVNEDYGPPPFARETYAVDRARQVRRAPGRTLGSSPERGIHHHETLAGGRAAEDDRNSSSMI